MPTWINSTPTTYQTLAHPGKELSMAASPKREASLRRRSPSRLRRATTFFQTLCICLEEEGGVPQAAVAGIPYRSLPTSYTSTWTQRISCIVSVQCASGYTHNSSETCFFFLHNDSTSSLLMLHSPSGHESTSTHQCCTTALCHEGFRSPHTLLPRSRVLKSAVFLFFLSFDHAFLVPCTHAREP